MYKAVSPSMSFYESQETCPQKQSSGAWDMRGITVYLDPLYGLSKFDARRIDRIL